MMKQISLMITSVALTFAMNICAQQSPWDKADAIVQSLDPVTFPDKKLISGALLISVSQHNPCLVR